MTVNCSAPVLGKTWIANLRMPVVALLSGWMDVETARRAEPRKSRGWRPCASKLCFQLLAAERERGLRPVAFQADSGRRVHEPPDIGLGGFDLILDDHERRLTRATLRSTFSARLP